VLKLISTIKKQSAWVEIAVDGLMALLASAIEKEKRQLLVD
jgi:hypothetical protein